MYTDPIADMLTRIRNACRAGLSSVDMPFSKLKSELAKVLLAEGYIKSFELLESPESKVHKTLRLVLKYDTEGYPVIRVINRISRPGLRQYRNARRMKRVLNGAGVAIITTSQGLMTDRVARQKGIGGEVLCEVL
ncbi:MAG: 30S ribosomal protein S8 [Vampirovibrionales bacterium]|nr:30S ribosomal protein S8 [Vampirovibrionales bacterium]